MLPLKDIEDAFIADALANITGFKTVATHEKDFDDMTLQSLMPRTPFCLIRYGGTDPVSDERGANGGSGTKKRQFYLAIGAATLRSKKEAQRGCYDLLDDVSERYDGYSLTVGSDQVTLAYDGDRLLFSEQGILVYGMTLSWIES